jgi:glucan 1,3-beta-glucosidase
MAAEEADDSAHALAKRRKLAADAAEMRQPIQPSEVPTKPDSQPIFLPPGAGLSQPSQATEPSQPEDPSPLATDAAAVQAHAVLRSAWEQCGKSGEEIPAEAFRAVRKMQQAAQAYWRDASLDLGKAAASVTRFLEQQRRLYWRKQPWRGVNLGGWLLLEPGPSAELFEKYGPAGCELDLMLRMREQLGNIEAERAITAHRERYITEDDFRCIQALGLNAVRIPFGYWVAMGAAEGDPYAGPGLEHLDRALAWCKAYGLQAVLDLHGAPGGESGERPCGRERKEWSWQEWRFDESVAALRAVATRYRGHPAISGISVCNEPSPDVPASALCRFYDRAVRAIREAGMAPDEVAIILPVYRTERLDEIWRLWSREFDGFAKHANTAFDLHLYHCFGTWWQRQGLTNQLRMVKRHRKILRRVPAVVGEWSLALPPQCKGDCQHEEDQALTLFAEAQLDAYSQASHGWFFWTWRDSPLQQPGWDLRKCITRHWINKNQFTTVPQQDSTSSSKACDDA